MTPSEIKIELRRWYQETESLLNWERRVEIKALIEMIFSRLEDAKPEYKDSD